MYPMFLSGWEGGWGGALSGITCPLQIHLLHRSLSCLMQAHFIFVEGFRFTRFFPSNVVQQRASFVYASPTSLLQLVLL